MSYLLKIAKWMVLTIVGFECVFLPSERCLPTILPQFLFWNSEQKTFLVYSNTRGSSKRNILKYLKQWLAIQSRIGLRHNTHLILNFGEWFFSKFHPTNDHFIAKKLQKNSKIWKPLCFVYPFTWLVQLPYNGWAQLFLLYLNHV